MTVSTIEDSQSATASGAGQPINAEPKQVQMMVKSIVEVASGIKQFELLPAEVELLPEVEAGAHIDVRTGNGLYRSYSLVNWGERHRYMIAVQLRPGSTSGSQFLHDFVEEGDELTVQLVANSFPLDMTARHSVLVAGGIGVTPILAMAQRLKASGASFELHYCGRDPKCMAYVAEVQSNLANHARIYFTDADGQPSLREIIGAAEEGKHLYVCGPALMIDEARLIAANWNVDNVHYERFVNRSLTAGIIRQPVYPFEVELARSGRILNVSATETLIEVLERNGIKIPHACMSGVCGTCTVPLLSGDVDHRDNVLTEEERKNRIQTCCSRAAGTRITIDR
jgi:vanillate O-demethylase ferredoxin subunit